MAAVDVSEAGCNRARVGEFPRHEENAFVAVKGARGGWEAGSRSAWPQPRREPEYLHTNASRRQARHGEPVGKKPAGDVNGVQTEFRVKLVSVSSSKDGAGDGVRTRDVQLG